MTKPAAFTVELRRHSMPTAHGRGLSPFGRRLATALAETLGPFDVVVSSPELRARDTAELLSGRVAATDECLAPVDGKLGDRSPHAGFRQLRRLGHQTAALGVGVLAMLEALADHSRRCLVVTHAGLVQVVAAACGGQGLGAAPRWCEGVLLRRSESSWECLGALRVDEERILDHDAAGDPGA